MAINSLYQTTRLVGMNSGFDTDSIIEAMLKSHQLKIDRESRAVTKLEWKQTALNSIKDDITSFKNTFLSSLGAQTMRMSASYNTTVASLSGKNSDAVSIKTSTGSSLGTMSIGRIESLAKGAKSTSSGSVSASGNGFSGSTKLSDIEFNGGKINFTDGEANININGEDITLKETETVDEMIRKINNSGAGVTMSYDRLSDKFSLESKTIGSSSTLSFSGEALDLMGLDQSNVSAGSTAVVTINGERVERDSNSFDYRGVTITLNRTTGENEEDTTVTLKRDVSDAVSKIKSFVESYNALIAKLEGLMKEKKTSTEAKYTPLTDDEKSAMSDDEVKEWEAKAKKGLLYNDSDLQSLTASLRGALFEAVQGAGVSPSQIGLSTGGYFDGKGGQIVLDEAKLTAALEKDPDQVMRVFTSVAEEDAVDNATKNRQTGLIGRMDSLFSSYMSGNQSRSLTQLKESIYNTNEKISAMEKKMYIEQERLYAKFAAMETALSEMQEQSSSVTALLGGG